MDINSTKHLVKSHLKTLFWFILFCLSIPVFLICYLVISTWKFIWLYLLTVKYSQIEFIKSYNIASVLDSQRNQGIIHVLLQIEGQCDIENIKDKLFKYVLDRKNKSGQLCYPKMRQCLTTCWGQYAWIKHETSKFNINNHVILSPPNYRGRSINEINVQEYISSIVSKYMPTDIPQWQIVIIPTMVLDTNTSKSYYMLLRMHHLLLAEEPDLSLNDVLMIDSFATLNVTFPSSKTSDKLTHQLHPFASPVYIPRLYGQIMVSLNNRWNEFIYKYDPIEFTDDPRASDCRKSERENCGLFKIAALIVISIVTVCRDFIKGFYATKSEPIIKLRFLMGIIRREMRKRPVSFNSIKLALVVSLHPVNLFKSFTGLVWWCLVYWFFKVPCFLFNEIIACASYFYGDNKLNNNGFLIEYIPLIIHSSMELLNIIGMILTAPKNIYEELFEHYKCNEAHALQTVTVCGRKAISWSEKTSICTARAACNRNKVHETELYFSVASAALMTFMDLYKMPQYAPKKMSTCIRFTSQDYLLGKKNYSLDLPEYICVNLPLQLPSTKHIQNIRSSFKRAQQNQVALFLLFQAQRRFDILHKVLPDIWIKLLFNYLSKIFTVSITQVNQGSHNQMTNTLWGHKIIDYIYFSPPQSNVSVSLTIQHFDDWVRLGVMADAQINPMHRKIPQAWTSFLEDF